MKATIDVPDELYRLVKAKSDSEGKAVPSWFGVLQNTARAVTRHDMDSIRESIARGIVRERNL